MNIKKIKPEYLISFILTALILIVAFAVNGIYPGSEKSILVFDMGAQYVAFFSYLHQLGSGYNSIMFQTFSALGGSFFGSWAYYIADPLSFVVLLFDEYHLPLAIYFLTVLKVSLCGLSFSIYLNNGRIKCDRYYLNVIASLSYALMSYNIIYSMNLMWIDGVLILPFVILGVDLVFEGKNSTVFILSLALSVMINYYTSYMVIIFTIIYFLYFVFSNNLKFKEIAKKGIGLFFSGIVSCLISACIWLPVFLDIRSGKLSEETKTLFGLIRNPLTVLRQFLPLSYGGYTSNGAPPVFCGLLFTVLFVLLFFTKNFSLRKKITSFIVLLVYMLSFCWDKLDVFWHVFQIPNFFPARYSFTLCFFLICVSTEFASCIFSSLERSKKSLFIWLIVFLSVFDIAFNSCYLIRSLNRDPVTGGYIKSIYFDYQYMINEYVISDIEDDHPRITTDIDFSSNDGLLFGLSSLDYFSSSYNYDLSAFLLRIGLNINHGDIDDLGLCPLSANLLGVDYLIQYFPDETYSSLTGYFVNLGSSNGFGMYKNPYSMPLGYMISQSEFDEFGYNAFDNLNQFNFDICGVDGVFKECPYDSYIIDTPNDPGLIRKDITVYPFAGEHLYFYISPEDYYDILDGTCFDELYIGDKCIASYCNVGNRSIVDLGISDGAPVTFTFDTHSDVSKVWFYSFDDELYDMSFNSLGSGHMTDISYDRDGIHGNISLSDDSDVLLLLPYEDGYTIFVDGSESDYDDYRNALIILHIPAGDHQIHIRYFTPGLKTGLLISFLGIIIMISAELIIKKNK